MIPETILTIIITIMQMLLLLGTVRMLKKTDSLLAVVFFGFGLACSILSNLYWMTYDILRPGTRMPIAANELAEVSIFLFFASSLKHIYDVSIKDHIRPAAAAALFAAANAALWIGWSGEWIQDLMTGTALGYLLCMVVTALIETKAFSRREWIVTCAVCFILIAAQTAGFFVSEAFRSAFDISCSVLLLSGCVYLIIRTVSALRKESRSAAALSFAACGWSTVSMYMSEDAVYTTAYAMSIVSFVLIFLSIRKEVKSA